jgi:hypothetical protein
MIMFCPENAGVRVFGVAVDDRVQCAAVDLLLLEAQIDTFLKSYALTVAKRRILA